MSNFFGNVRTIRANYTAAQTNTILVPLQAGCLLYVVAISATCDKANTVDVAVLAGFGTTTTPTATGVVLAHPGIAAGSGLVYGGGGGIVGQSSEGQGLLVTCEEPTTGSMDVVVSYYRTGPNAA